MAKVDYRRIPDFTWSLDRLADPETYMAEARRGRDAGIPGCGVFGAACPRCYKQISFHAHPAKRAKNADLFCACADTEPLTDADALNIIATLGLNEQRFTTSATTRAV